MNKSDLLNAFTSKPIKTLEDIPGLPGVTLHIATLSAYTAQHLYNDELREKMMADKAFLAALFIASVCQSYFACAPRLRLPPCRPRYPSAVISQKRQRSVSNIRVCSRGSISLSELVVVMTVGSMAI